MSSIKIKLGDLKDKKGELAEFLEKKLNIKGDMDGDDIDFTDPGVTASTVKTYLKKFLHSNGARKNHRIFVEKGVLKIATLESGDQESE